MRDSFLIIAGAVCDLRDTINTIKMRVIQAVKEKTGQSESEISLMFKMPQSDYGEIPLLAQMRPMDATSTPFQNLPERQPAKDKFYQYLLNGPSASLTLPKYT